MAVLLHIRGKVQGVFYRASAKEQADRLGITGWVRNEADGSVMAHAEGNAVAVQAFTTWCRQGPVWAVVTEVFVEEVGDQRLTSFEIRRQ